MEKFTQHCYRTAFLLIANVMFSHSAFAQAMNLPNTPLFVDGNKTGLVQLVVQRDESMFFEAYPSYEDIDGDGVVDNTYKPDTINYVGYFDSGLCYAQAAGNDAFVSYGRFFAPGANAVNKTCPNPTAPWSGDFLNYLTMTRMDIMRQALYGGKRSIDLPLVTVLRRAFVPADNHTWGIEYTSPAVDGYRIADYTPLSQPASGQRHLFANNNYNPADQAGFPMKALGANAVPLLRIRVNSNERIWDWVDSERTQGDGDADWNLIVDVQACKWSTNPALDFKSDNCKQYGNLDWKPTGVLHEYGETNQMYFGLVTGSYRNNLQGGVLRQIMASFSDEEVYGLTGSFKPTSKLIKTLDSIQIPNDYDSLSAGGEPVVTVLEDCGWINDRGIRNGECKAWGNPIAEMMYEGLRYLAGEETPTGAFNTTASVTGAPALPTATWDNPYDDGQPYSQCSGAYQLVISNPAVSYDGDQLPGSSFGSFGGTFRDMNVSTIADFISGHEPQVMGTQLIGESNGVADNSPSPKTVTSFSNIRGLPQAPHREGSYLSSSVSYYGSQNDLHPNVEGVQNVGNFTLALGSTIPTIDVPVGGQIISFAPFGKSIADGGALTNYFPTNAIPGIVVESVTPTTGSYRVSFADLEQGADNDMDAIVRFSYVVTGNTVEFTADSFQAMGTAIQHMGYTVSGSNNDGIFLVVRDADTDVADDLDFDLDVPPTGYPHAGLPLTSTISFTPSSTPGTQKLESPLWYAAKWGGFNDINGDGIAQRNEWDANRDGQPDNYFKGSNPAEMKNTLRSVFSAISESSASASAVGVSSGSLSNDARIYEASFRTNKWYGDLTSRGIDENGVIADVTDWNVNTSLEQQISNDSRTIITIKPSTGEGIAFRWPNNEATPGANELDAAQVAMLATDPLTEINDAKGELRLNYLRGFSGNPTATNNPYAEFRFREKPLGDIVNSSPQLVGPPASYYPDDWGPGAPESDSPYSEYGKLLADRDRVVYVGANDGMLHGFDAGSLTGNTWSAGTGEEVFAYVPSKAYKNLPNIGNNRYAHNYFVDATPRIADAIVDDEWQTVLVGGLGRGGQGVYALNVTDVSDIDEDDADKIVMWEFTDEDDADLGYTYTSPLVARMHNGRWAAIFGNGFNSTENDGNASTNGKGAIFIVDLETGDLIRKIRTNQGTLGNPNGIKAPTAVDLDNDNIIDVIYAGDLAGRITKYDVTSTNPAAWDLIGGGGFGPNAGQFARTADRNVTQTTPITTEISVGTHPTGEGVLVYFATGKYLEATDQQDTDTLHRVYALWDKNPLTNTSINVPTAILTGQLLEQSITNETTFAYDSDNDGRNDSIAEVRESTENEIDWNRHMGWYVNLDYPTRKGEQVLAPPFLRENKLIVSTHIPYGDDCNPGQDGWLLLFDAESGGMPGPSVDIDGDGKFTNAEQYTGIRGVNNPLAAPTIAAAQNVDILLTNSDTGDGAKSTRLDAATKSGRVSWRELPP